VTEPTTRPDYIACVRDTHVDRQGLAWCGRHAPGWAFQDADHAALNGRGQGRMVVCPECRKALVAALENGA
jgi:hypothetical protein